MSLFLRLAIGFVLLIALCGGVASYSAWQQTRDTVNELFDTQQMLFAKRLLPFSVRTASRCLTMARTGAICSLTLSVMAFATDACAATMTAGGCCG